MDEKTHVSAVSKKSLQSITTKASRRGIFDEPSYIAKKTEQKKAIEKKLYEMKAFNPIATPRLVDSKQVYKRKNLDDFPNHLETSENILKLTKEYNKTASNKYFDLDRQSQKSMKSQIQVNLNNHLEKR